MSKGMRDKLRALDRKLTGDTFWGQFARYVLNTTLDEDYEVWDNTVKELRQPSQRVHRLAAQVAANAPLFAEHLPRFVVADGHRLYEFGVKLAEAFCSQETVEAVIAAQLSALPEMKTQFIGEYFAGLKARFSDLWEVSVSRLLYDDTGREIGVAVLLGAGVSENIVCTLLDLFRQGRVKAIAFSRLVRQAEPDRIPQVLVERVLAALVDSADDEAFGVAIALAHDYFFDKKNPRSCDEALILRLLSADRFFRQNLETTTGFYWHAVAEGFCERFPGRDLELLSVILSHLEHLSSLRSPRSPSHIAEEIARTHPDEAWSRVSRLLESDETHSSGVASWLGDKFGFAEPSPAGAIRHFDPEMVMAWVLQNPEIRVRKLRHCLPKTFDEKDGGRLTSLFLEAFGDHEEVADCLMVNFWSGGRTGPESAYLAGKRDKARQWISENQSGRVLAWLSIHRVLE